MSAVSKLSTVFNASAAMLVGAVLMGHSKTHAFSTNLLKEDWKAIHTFVVGSTGKAIIKDKSIDEFDHAGSLRIINSSIKTLNNVGSVRVSLGKIENFSLYGSVRAQDSSFGSGSVVGSTQFINTYIDKITISADTVRLIDSHVIQDVVLTDPRNGHESNVTLDNTVIEGKLICKKHCHITQTNGSVVRGGIIN